MPADCEWPDDAAAVETLRAGLCELLLFARGNDVVLGKVHGLLDVLTAVEASPVIPVPPCPTCDGERYWSEPDSHARGRIRACPSCNGSGRDRLIPESEIRAWIDDLRLHDDTGDRIDVGYMDALDDLRERLDERGER